MGTEVVARPLRRAAQFRVPFRHGYDGHRGAGSEHHQIACAATPIRYGERVAAAGIEGSVDREGGGDCGDNVLAASVIGLNTRPRSSGEAALGRASEPSSWRPSTRSNGPNDSRLVEPIGSVPPAALEQAYYQGHPTPRMGRVTRANESPMTSERFKAVA